MDLPTHRYDLQPPASAASLQRPAALAPRTIPSDSFAEDKHSIPTHKYHMYACRHSEHWNETCVYKQRPIVYTNMWQDTPISIHTNLHIQNIIRCSLATDGWCDSDRVCLNMILQRPKYTIPTHTYHTHVRTHRKHYSKTHMCTSFHPTHAHRWKAKCSQPNSH